jgi:hypothetical protein
MDGGRAIDSARDVPAMSVRDAPDAVDPVDQTVCQRLCDLSASVACGDEGRCMDGCLASFADGRCLAERRALVSCQADVGPTGLTCMDGSTFVVEGLCTDEIALLGTCLFARKTEAAPAR